MIHSISGEFETQEKAEAAQLYLMANGFSDGNPDDNINITDDATLINVALRKGNKLILHLETSREAQEGIDVLNNYGAFNVVVKEF